MLTAYSSVFRYGAVIAPRLAFARRAWSAFLGTLCVISAPVALAQTFVSQGPSPISGTLDDVQSGDLNNGTRGTVTGAIQAVLPDPVNPNVIYIGATNGGVWKTSNGGQSWTPLTDKQVSLSVGGLAFDPTDQSRQKLYVAMGATSSGGIGAGTVTSGQLPGILYSPDGGTSWITLAGTAASPVKLQDKSLIGVAARGSTILAAADLPNSSALGSGGLFRSTDGGRTFNDITPGGPVPAGSGVTSLVSDPTRTYSFYAAVSGKGIFVSNDTGNTWSTTNKFPPIGTNQAAKLATGPGGSVVAAVYETAKGLTAAREDGKLVEVYLSLDSGATWKALGGDAVRNATTYAHLAVAIDRNNPNIVYLAGDVKQPSDKVIALGAFRLTLNPDGTTTLDSLTESGTANNTTVHPDARAFAFDAFGRLLLGTDGGLYTRTNPTTNGGVWMGLNTSTLQAGEVYAIAYDSRSHRVVVALQDTGVGQQMARGSVGYNALVGADGLNAAVNEHAFTDHSVLYYSTQNLGLTRVLVDANGRTSDPISFGTNNSRPGVLNFDPVDFTEEEKGKKVLLPFASKLVLNKNDPTKIAIGTNFVYTTTDDLMVQSASETNPTPLTKRVATTNVLGGTVSAMSYGTADKVDALLVGAPNGLFWTTSAADLVKVPTYMGSQPISVVFDYNSSSRFFAADGNDLWHLKNGGSDVSRHADDLRKLNIARPTAVEFIANNGVNALLVGGMVTDISAKSPLAAVNVDKDNGDLLPATWTSFGTNLPNALIGQLSYNRWADVLAVGTFGRGAWLLYDVTAYFDTATVLRFGRADNDSAPEARFLSNGILPSRELEKVGTGTLTIAGTTSYTGGTTVFGGTMVVNGSIASSSGLTVNPGGTLSGGGIVPATTMMGAIAPGWAANAPTTLTVNTSYTQTAGSTYRALINAAGQSDRIAVNGPASIQGGALAVTAQSGGLFAPRTTYTLLSAMGGVSGGFSSSSLSLGSAFLQPSITSDADNIYLNLTINGFLAAAQTPLQAAVGGAIDSSVYSATGDYATVLGILANLSPSQVPSILTSLSGMNYSGFSNSMVQGAQLFMNNFLAQVSGANRGSNKLVLAEACDVACDATEPAKWGVWGGGLGGLGTVGAGQPVGGVTYNLGGFAAGLDRRITNSTLAGVTVGYAGGTQWVSGFSGQGYSDTFFAGLYGAYAQGPVYLDGVVGYAHTDNRLARSIVIPGLAARTATGQTGANQVYGQLEGGYRFDIGTAADASITPFARLQAYSGTQKAFTENGAQSLSLNVAAQTTNSLRTVFGAQIGGAMDLGWREKLAVQLRLGWGHEYADTNRPVAASFLGAPSAPFTTYGISPQRDSAVVGFAANTAIADATSVYLRYEGNISGQDSSHALTAGLRMTW
jgi:autotransporter-associated beta strand protein